MMRRIPAGRFTSAFADGSRPAVWVAAALILLANVLAYATSFRGALVFDDLPGIAHNPTIRDLSQPGLLLEAIGPRGGTLAGRPVPNFTLALNYAIGGLELGSYHAANLLIHVGAALALFGLVRRTLGLPSLAGRFVGCELPLAAVIALLWSLHPLQTESVTYLVQRVESLMGLFYLLTLYCFVRAVTAAQPARWQIGAFFACLAGMGCKEVMVSAPVLVCIYDRIFVATSWREVWLRRRWIHGALLSTWILLGVLVVVSGGRGGTAGFEAGIAWWQYALTQTGVIPAYLKLAAWPHPLVFDHNAPLAAGLGAVWLPALVLLGLLAATIWLLVRRPAAGFPCLAFFAILAPTSSVVPIADVMVEHRMYLPLAAAVVLAVIVAHRRLGAVALPLWLGVGAAFGGATAIRNLDYESPMKLWTDTAEKNPASARAHNNLGAYLFEEGRNDEALARFTTALRLDPKHASAHYNLAKLLEKTGRDAEAVAAYESAVRFNPRLIDARVNLGHLLDRTGRPADAAVHFEEALRLDPDAADIHAGLGAALLKLKRVAPAIAHLRTALELEPDRAETWCSLSRAHQQQNDPAAARRAGERALQLRPDFPEALYVLGNLDAAAGNFAAGVVRFRRAVELAPDYLAARNNLANALLVTGAIDEAIGHYRQILAGRPEDRSVQENLAHALELQRAARTPANLLR